MTEIMTYPLLKYIISKYPNAMIKDCAAPMKSMRMVQISLWDMTFTLTPEAHIPQDENSGCRGGMPGRSTWNHYKLVLLFGFDLDQFGPHFSGDCGEIKQPIGSLSVRLEKGSESEVQH